MTSCYVHIPFCKKKCNYCAFCSFSPQNEQILCYFESLKKEAELKLNSPLKTLYFGGGTPSFVPVEFYKTLHFDFEDSYEFTFEVNPATVDKKYLEELYQLGVNRLSIGVQSFFDEDLQNLGRVHSAVEAIDCVKLAHSVGFDNISIDLIYGLPMQTLEKWEFNLKQALELPISHISTYGLKIEDGTPWGEKPPEGLPDEDICADMYLFLVNFLEKNGFFQYEISNFAKNGYQGQHNCNYWQNNEYIALGLGASGYENGVRYQNTCNFEDYIKNPQEPFNKIILNKDNIIEEAIFLGFRLKNGINLYEFKDRYNIDLLKEYENIFEKYKDFFEFEKKSVKFTLNGMMISNSILAEFIK